MSYYRQYWVDALVALTDSARPAHHRLTDAQVRALRAFAHDLDCTTVDLLTHLPFSFGWHDCVGFMVRPLMAAPISGAVDARGTLTTVSEVSA